MQALNLRPHRCNAHKVMLMRTRAKPIHRDAAFVRYYIPHRPLHVREAISHHFRYREIPSAHAKQA